MSVFVAVENGQAIIDILENIKVDIDLILMDRMMSFIEGLNAGVFYYFSKPTGEYALRAGLLAESCEVKQNKTLDNKLKNTQAKF